MTTAPKSERIDEFLRLLSAGDRRLYGYILSLVPNFHDADDIAQECRTRLWQQFDSYESGTDFDAWARAIAYYLVLAHREKSQPHSRPLHVADELGLGADRAQR